MVEEGRREVQAVRLDSAWAVCGVLVDLYVVRGSRSGYLEHPRMESRSSPGRQLLAKMVSEQHKIESHS
jgi:hypothetical protein